MAVEVIIRNAALTKAVDAFYKQKAGQWGWAILGQAYRKNETKKGGQVRLKLILLDEPWAESIRAIARGMEAVRAAAKPPKAKLKTKARKHK